MKQSANGTLTSLGFGVRPIGVTDASALRAKKAFVRWLNRHHPKLLKAALDESNITRKQVGLSGLGQTTDSSTAWYDTVLNKLPSLITGYAAFQQQKSLIDLNKKRAEQGLPPLQNAPTINVQGEAGPQTRAALQSSIKEAAGQYIPYIAGGLGLFLLLNNRKGGRRR